MNTSIQYVYVSMYRKSTGSFLVRYVDWFPGTLTPEKGLPKIFRQNTVVRMEEELPEWFLVAWHWNDEADLKESRELAWGRLRENLEESKAMGII